MNSMFLAEFAIFIHFQSLRVVLFVLHCIIIPLFALLTRKSNLCAHDNNPPQLKKRLYAFYYSILVDSIIIKKLCQ